jgi:iron(III) transport system permease protein
VALCLWAVRRPRVAGRYAVISGRGTRTALLPLGKARWPAALAAWLLTALAVGLPYLMVLWMSVNTSWFGAPTLAHLSLANYAYVLTEYPNTWRIVGNSLPWRPVARPSCYQSASGVAYVRYAPAARPDALAMAASHTVILPSVAFVTGVIWAWIRPPFASTGR